MDKKLPSKIVSVALSLLLFIGCTHRIQPLPPPSPSNGLLFGRIHWQQAGREIVRLGPVGSVTRLYIQDFKTLRIYSADITRSYFQIPLPPGQYRLYAASISNAEVQEPDRLAVAAWWGGTVTAILVLLFATGGGGGGGGCCGGGGVETESNADLVIPFYRYGYAPFDIKENEATFIGALHVNAREVKARESIAFFAAIAPPHEVTVSEEGEAEMLKELTLQFSHIKRG